MHRRALTAALASATVALGGALAVTTVPAQAEPGVSPLKLRVPDRVVARSYDGWVYSNLGVRMVAQGQNFEIRATRPDTYDAPISAEWMQWDTDGTPLPSVELPADAMTTWQGLDDFANVRIFRVSDGRRIRHVQTTGCFNGDSQKVGPDGPSSDPYPWGCPWNPYTLGSVMGVAKDYAGSLLPEWGTNLRLKPGTYRMVAAVNADWREQFGISAADGIVSTELVVKKVRNRWRDTSFSMRGSDQLEATTEAPTSSSQGAPVDEFAPDLRALPAFDISLNGKGTAMRFGATVWNGGAGPMVIEGFKDDHEHTATRSGDDEHGEHMTAYQYYFDGNGNQTGYDEVGQFTFHEGNHNHWHFEDFARYNLYGADAEGNRLDDIVVKSTKASFCLVATDAVDLTVPNADMRPEYTDLGSQCGGRNAQMLRQVLANGHGDTYHQFRTGQAFRIGNVPDGIYYIGVEANPADDNGRNLQELDYDNNDSFRKVEIKTNPRTGKRKVVPFQVGIIDEFNFGEFLRR